MNELLERKAELEAQIEELRKDVKTYYAIKEKYKEIETEISDIDRKLKYAKHKDIVKRCFKAKNDGYKGVEAFFVIKILDSPNENYALCFCLTKKDTNNAFRDYAIGTRVMVLPLWTYSTLRMTYKEDDEKVIDLYEEISLDEFSEIYNDISNKMTKIINTRGRII